MKKLLTCLLLLPFTTFSQAISVNIYQGENLMDGVAIYYNGQSDGVDLRDSKKINNPSVNIAIISSDTLAVEQRTTYATVQLRAWNLTPGEDYRLEIIAPGISNAFLIDSNNYHAIGERLSYPFTVTKTGTNRFRLAFCSVLSINENSVPLPVRNPIIYTIYEGYFNPKSYTTPIKPHGLLKKINNNTYLKL